MLRLIRHENTPSEVYEKLRDQVSRLEREKLAARYREQQAKEIDHLRQKVIELGGVPVA